MSLSDIKKNEPTIIIQEIIKQKHAPKRLIRKSYDAASALEITRRNRQYVRLEKMNSQRCDTITRIRLKNSYIQLRTRSPLFLSFLKLLSSLLKSLLSFSLSYPSLPRSLSLSLSLILISLELLYNVKKH